MFSNDRFMTMATGLVLAIAVGAMAQNSGALIAFFTGEDMSPGQDDQYTINAGKSLTLDVLANDNLTGEITIVDHPSCGEVRTTSNGALEFLNSESCSGDVAFSYCVAADEECEVYQVALNVINIAPATVAETQIAAAPAPAATLVPAPVAVIETTSEPVVTARAIPPAETANAAPVAVTQGDRLTAGQILLVDDSEDVTVAGFGATAGPSLFAPDMQELIQPQETVAILRRSVEVVAPSRITQDQNIQTQTSATTPSRIETASNSLQGDVLEGTEASPVVSFSSPSQPRLSRAPMLAPVAAQPQAVAVMEHGPEIFSTPPTHMANFDFGESAIVAPANADITSTTVVAALIGAPSGNDAAMSADTNTAPIGAVMIASDAGTSDVSDGIEVASVSVDGSAPTIGRSPTLTQTEDTTVVAAGPDIRSAAPSGISFDDSLIDSLVASISVDNAYVAPAPTEGELLAALAEPDAIGTLDNQTASVGQVSINAADPADSSDIVVEMAAQILLPSPQLNDSLTRVIQPTPATEALLSDKLFAADLEASAPPSTDPVEVASIAPEATIDVATSALANSQCDVRMSASARPGAGIAVFVSSPCRAGQVLTMSHSDFSFSAYTDETGTFSATIPAFASSAIVDVEFDDGAVASSQVLLRDADDFERMAIVWSDPVNLDLHAFEGDAGENGKGHVWAKHPRTYRDTLTGRGGYLETFGDVTIVGGTMSEVYSLPTNRIRSETTVRLDLRINGIDGHCDNNMVLRTIRSADQGKTTKREFNLKLPQCGEATGGLVLESFVDAISVARR